MFRILFVCTANLYRSPLAAAFLSRRLQADGHSQDWIVKSAGTWTTPGQRAPADLLQAARDFGIDLKRHRTQRVSRDLLAQFDLIVVMERGHREALRVEFPSVQEKLRLFSELVERLEYDIPDPAHSRSPVEEIIWEMSKGIERAYPNLCQFAQAADQAVPFPIRHNVNFTL